MSKKIVLFLSALKSDAEEKEYRCPAGVLGLPEDVMVSGTQTNEAPVKAMLLAYPDIQSIICIVTPEAKESALDFFKEHILTFAQQHRIGLTDASFKIIDFAKDEVFTEQTIQKILDKTVIEPGRMGKNAAGDEILLETTGGLRDTMMYLLLLSRILTFNRNQTIGATYVDFQKKQINDVSNLIQMFDLVGGLQEMSSFGNVRTLRKYFGEQPADERIAELLSSLEALNEAISLCRTKQINICMQRFNTALKAVEECDDPLMRVLIPAFRYTFKDKTLSITSLIRWCLDADMLQQAMTVYNERIPAEIFGRKILTIDEGTQRVSAPKYTDEDVQQFLNGFLRSSNRDRYLNKYQVREHNDYLKEKKYENASCADQLITIDDMGRILPYSGYTRNPAYPVEQIQTIARDYLYIRQLRNMTNHANDGGLSDTDVLMTYLEKHGYPPLEEVTVTSIKKTVGDALDHLKEQPQEPKTNKNSKKKGKK